MSNPVISVPRPESNGPALNGSDRFDSMLRVWRWPVHKSSSSLNIPIWLGVEEGLDVNIETEYREFQARKG
jgi:hypothetical protein